MVEGKTLTIGLVLLSLAYLSTTPKGISLINGAMAGSTLSAVPVLQAGIVMYVLGFIGIWVTISGLIN